MKKRLKIANKAFIIRFIDLFVLIISPFSFLSSILYKKVNLTINQDKLFVIISNLIRRKLFKMKKT